MQTAPQELRTTRLLLRSLEDGDIAAIKQLAGAREIAATTLKIPHPYTEDDARNFLAHAADDFRNIATVNFAISISPGRDLCGIIGLVLSSPHRSAELGYWIGAPFWGNGYASEAAAAVMSFGFEKLRLHRIYAHHFAGNIASKRVLEKIGMRHEGTMRQHIQKWDRFIDVENYGLLAAEFPGEK